MAETSPQTFLIIVPGSGCIFILDAAAGGVENADSAVSFTSFSAKFRLGYEFPRALGGSAGEPSSVTLSGHFGQQMLVSTLPLKLQI